jgi:hypothetical protein
MVVEKREEPSPSGVSEMVSQSGGSRRGLCHMSRSLVVRRQRIYWVRREWIERYSRSTL